MREIVSLEKQVEKQVEIGGKFYRHLYEKLKVQFFAWQQIFVLQICSKNTFCWVSFPCNSLNTQNVNHSISFHTSMLFWYHCFFLVARQWRECFAFCGDEVLLSSHFCPHRLDFRRPNSLRLYPMELG